jgi:hypothetical protein
MNRDQVTCHGHRTTLESKAMAGSGTLSRGSRRAPGRVGGDLVGARVGHELHPNRLLRV